MSDVLINTLNPALDDDILQLGNMQNSDAIRAGFTKITNQVLGAVTQPSDQGISTTAAPVQGLGTTTNSSGGLHHVYANVAYVAVGGNGTFNLLMDGQTIATSYAVNGGNSNTTTHSVPIQYFGNVPAGQHTFAVQAVVDGGSNPRVLAGSQIYVVEHLT